jgi:pimeloyl-ACP methyl ester carboxylesterase
VSWSSRSRCAVTGAVSALLLASGSSAASAEGGGRAAEAPVPELAWEDCATDVGGTEAGVQCALAALPMDYDEPDGEQVHIAVARVPATDTAQRIGSLFFNFGGPGAASVDYLQAVGAGVFERLNQRFDIIGFDPRGVGQSTPAIDCQADEETEGIYSVPVPTPLDIDEDAYVDKAQSYVDACLANNGAILEHVSTANVARDMDALRAALGEEQLSYLGYSYGTFLGATYASLFPDRYRAMTLDGPVEAAEYVNDPLSNLAAQTAAFEVALGRFFEACAIDQAACSDFGGSDPWLAYDKLVAAAETSPIPAPGYTPDPRPVGGDEIRMASASLLYAKQLWGVLGQALSEAAAGDATLLRAELDEFFWGREEDGTFSPSLSRYFAIGASEQQYPRDDLQTFLDRGAESWASFPHAWWNSGYAEISYALWPVRDEDAFLGPFTVPDASATVLVVATTYDPATPYSGGLSLVEQLGNARLLTMEGDGHTAYGGNTPCVDSAVDSYLVAVTLPGPGTVCEQDVPFTAPEPEPAGSGAATSSLRVTTAVGALVGARG